MYQKKLIIFICTSILITSCAFSNIHILKYDNFIDIENREIENKTLEINSNFFSNEINISLEKNLEDAVENQNEFTENILNQLRQLFDFKWNNANHFDGNLTETPEYMTELYQSITKNESSSRNTYPFNSNTVRSYIESNISLTRGHFMFDVNSDEMNYLRTTDILEAELRVYRLSVNFENETFAPLITPPYFLLKVYQVTDIKNLETPDIQTLLNVHCVSYFNSGWQIFNIKSAVQSWISGDKPNLGLLVIATTLFGNCLFINFSRRDFQTNILQPVMVLYEGKTRSLVKQSELSDENQSLNIRSFESEIDANQNLKSSVCRRKDFYLNFTTLGWSEFIIAPMGYNAYNCKGNCNFPLNLKLTNHAAIQTLLYELKIENVTNSCCVPHKLLPLNILYYLDFNIIVLKKYDQMIVQDCTCK